MASERAMCEFRLLVILLMLVCVGCSNNDDATTDPTEIHGRVGALEDIVIKQQRLITDLQNDRAQQNDVNTKLRNDLAKQKSLVIGCLNIQHEMDEQRIVNHQLQNDIDKLKQLNTILENRVDIEETLVAGLQDEIAAMKQETGDIMRDTTEKGQQSLIPADKHKRLHIKRSPPQARQLDAEITVAFSAGVSQIISHIGVNQDIVFDRVEINEGNGYNPHHGIFVAPVPGIYVFYSTIYASHAYGHQSIYCHFVVNGMTKNDIYAESTSSASDTSNQMLITEVKKGDDVAVQVRTATGAIYTETDVVLSTFSGFMLKQVFLRPIPLLGD